MFIKKFARLQGKASFWVFTNPKHACVKHGNDKNSKYYKKTAVDRTLQRGCF